jgi:hypothetical protein
MMGVNVYPVVFRHNMYFVLNDTPLYITGYCDNIITFI